MKLRKRFLFIEIVIIEFFMMTLLGFFEILYDLNPTCSETEFLSIMTLCFFVLIFRLKLSLAFANFIIKVTNYFFTNFKFLLMSLVKKDGVLLRRASDRLKNDNDVVLAAVKQNGLALAYVSDELKSDRDVVLAAVKQNIYALNYASNELQFDKGVLYIVSNNEEFLKSYNFIEHRNMLENYKREDELNALIKIKDKETVSTSKKKI